MKITFYSLQGLGNSIINFPILHRLRQHHEVRVVAFNNGSAAFFRAFHQDTTSVSSRAELLKFARASESDAVFTCYPTWRRELSSNFLSHAPRKYLARPVDRTWARWFWKFKIDGDASLHHLENNLRLLDGFPDVEAKVARMDEALGISSTPKGRVLSVHPTASTPVKYFPLKFWQELLRECLSEYDRVQIFCGKAPEEVEFCDRLRASLNSPKVSQHVGLEFRALSEAIGASSQFIGTDSALMHLAAMMGKKVLGLWSFANYRVIFPYGDQVQVYLPKETLASRTYDYPKEVPAYLQRAEARRAFEILHERQPEEFILQPRFAKNIRFYTY